MVAFQFVKTEEVVVASKKQVQEIQASISKNNKVKQERITKYGNALCQHVDHLAGVN